jgi:nitrile hydratase beta subunit
VFTRNAANDIGGTVGLGPVPMETDEPGWRSAWERRAFGASVAAVIKGMLIPPTQRAAFEALHPVTYLSMTFYERWLYALEQCAVTTGVLTREEIEARVVDTLEDPDAPMPQDRNPEILEGVRGFLDVGMPLGPEQLSQPPRFARGDIVRTKRIELEAPGWPHTRMPGYAQERVGVIEFVHRPMLLEDILVASGEIHYEYVYAVRLRTREVWPDAGERYTNFIDLWESYLEDDALPPANEHEEQP